MSGAITLLPLYASLAWIWKTLRNFMINMCEYKFNISTLELLLFYPVGNSSASIQIYVTPCILSFIRFSPYNLPSGLSQNLCSFYNTLTWKVTRSMF